MFKLRLMLFVALLSGVGSASLRADGPPSGTGSMNDAPPAGKCVSVPPAGRYISASEWPPSGECVLASEMPPAGC